jgi:hypothetical protein
MSHKTSPARRAAFIAAVAETGNQTIAAERAKVSRSWVHLQQSTDPAFRAELDAAIATAKTSFDRLRTNGNRGSNQPSAKWAYLDGEELVIRGTNGVRAQISRARLKQWTARTEAVFLRTLAATANVKAACAAAGLSVPSAYVHRSKYPAFAKRWAEAIEIGAERLEWQLLESGCNAFEPASIDPTAPIPPMDVEHAIRMVGMYRKADGWHGGNRSHRHARVRTLKEVMPSLQRKLAAVERAQARAEATLAHGRARGHAATDKREDTA